MPTKEWTSEADFGEWTLVDIVANVDGEIELDVGESSGTATSPVYEAADWMNWGRLRVTCEQPEGTNVLVEFRSGESSAECLASDWSSLMDEADDDGVIVLNPHVWFANNPTATVGAYIQLRITLMAE